MIARSKDGKREAFGLLFSFAGRNATDLESDSRSVAFDFGSFVSVFDTARTAWYNIGVEEQKNKKTGIPWGFRAASVVLMTVAGVLTTVFAALKTAEEATASSVLFTVAGGLLFVTAGIVVASMFLPAEKRSVLSLVALAPHAVAFLLVMIGGILRRGQYTLTVEIVLFAFAAVSDAMEAAVSTERFSPKKALIVGIGFSVLACVLIFIPAFVGQKTAIDILQTDLPLAAAIVAVNGWTAAEIFEKRSST